LGSELGIMQIDPSQLTGPHTGDPQPKPASQWDALEPLLPKSGDGSHLMACPNCGMENGMPCLVCWNCEGPLTPQPSLRLVTRDGAEVATGAEPDTRTSAEIDPLRASLLSALGEHPVRDDPAPYAASAVQAQADARGWLPEWTTALDPQEQAAGPAPAADSAGINVRVVAGVVVAMLIAGAFGYFEVHSNSGAGSSNPGTVAEDGATAAGGSAGGARRPLAEAAATKAGQPSSLEDALQAADRALGATAADTAGAAEAPAAALADDGVVPAEVPPAAPKRRAPAASVAGAPTAKAAPKSTPPRTVAAPPAPAAPAAPPRPCSPTLAALGLCQSASN
jgi:hypothetical protein